MKSKANRGFTLVELLVSVAVLSIVTLGIGGLLKLAAEQYSNATKETEVQNLIQSTFASMSNAIEDAAIDVVFESNKLTIVNEDGYIRFERDGSRLYYDEVTAYSSATDNDGKIQEARDHETSKDEAVNLLADHVKSFSVDTTTKDRGFIILNVTIEYHERSKNLVQNVFLRNLRSRETVEYTASTSTTTGDGGDGDGGDGDGGDGDGGDGDGGDGDGGGHTTPPQITYTNSPSFNDNTLSITFSNGTQTNDVQIKKTAAGYVLTAASKPWLLDQDNMKMPGYDANKTTYLLTDQQISWLKDKCDIDLTDYAFVDPNPGAPIEAVVQSDRNLSWRWPDWQTGGGTITYKTNVSGATSVTFVFDKPITHIMGQSNCNGYVVSQDGKTITVEFNAPVNGDLQFQICFADYKDESFVTPSCSVTYTTNAE